MCKACQTVLGAAAADESIMCLSIDGMRRKHVKGQEQAPGRGAWLIQ